MIYTTIDYFLLIFFDFTLLFVDVSVFFALAISWSGLLNLVIIFSASFKLIFLVLSFILDLINSIIFVS